MFFVVWEFFEEQGGFKGVLKGIQGIGAGAGHGIGEKGELDTNNTEGRERIWRHELELDGADSSEDNGRGQGYVGLTKVGGSHMNICVWSIVDKRAMITASNYAYRDWQDFWRHACLHLKGACDKSRHQFS